MIVENGRRVGWTENDLAIAGGGQPTRLLFWAGPSVGSNPIHLRIYDDVLGSAAELTYDLVIEPRVIKPDTARKRLTNIRKQLATNHRIIMR